jgi:hypothetical protein
MKVPEQGEILQTIWFENAPDTVGIFIKKIIVFTSSVVEPEKQEP